VLEAHDRYTSDVCGDDVQAERYALQHTDLLSLSRRHYHMLTKHEAFHDLGDTYLDERNQTHLIQRTVERFAQLSYQVTIEPIQLVEV
jgi:hypothetical protein